MSRIACLRIPRFPIAVHQKHEPSLKNAAFVLLDEKAGTSQSLSRMRVIMCSQAASKKMVVSGMKLAVARSTCADLILRYYDPPIYAEAKRQLVGELIACSPRVSAKDNGVFLLDAHGLALRGGEGKLCRDLLKLASKNGFTEGRVGIADSAFAALVASRFKSRRWYIVEPGQDAQFLARLPLSQLPLDPESMELFDELGIKSVGEFADLPCQSLAGRFGEEVLKVRQLAIGLDFAQPQIPVPEKQFVAGAEIGFPMESLNETLFVLKSLLDRLTAELKQEKLCAEEMMISFYNDDDKFDERPVRLACPSNNAKFLLELLRLSLEAQPLKRQFTAVKLDVSRSCEETWQQTRVKVQAASSVNETSGGALTFDDDSIADARALLLQRFAARLGEHALVYPVANDQYRLDLAGIWMPVLNDGTRARASQAQFVEPVAVDACYISENHGEHGLSSGFVLKRFPHPEPVFVEIMRGRPVALTYRSSWYHVRMITTAECLSGLWWDDSFKFRRSYYVALLDRGEVSAGEPLQEPLMVSLLYDNDARVWSIEGVFD